MRFNLCEAFPNSSIVWAHAPDSDALLGQHGGTEHKKIVEMGKKIQEFKLRLGLVVDKPKPLFGRSNDGNKGRNSSKISKFHQELQVLIRMLFIENGLYLLRSTVLLLWMIKNFKLYIYTELQFSYVHSVIKML